jgi:DNA-binding NtrC family response regulator
MVKYAFKRSDLNEGGAKVGNNTRVVIVDDEAQITELLKAFVLHTAPETVVHTFNDSTIAREFVTHNRIDVLITDNRMPGLDGIQLLEAASSDVTKIILSGRILENDDERLKRLNATFLEKPVQLRALAKIIWPQPPPALAS